MKKILIADDHQIVRKGLKQIISDEFGDTQFGEAANAIEVFKRMKENEWDILILDINMPGRSGLDVLKQLKDEKSGMPVLILSMHPEDIVAVRALKSGASGYLPKDSADTELVNAIRQIFNGKKYITPSVAEQVVLQIENPQGKDPHELLSDREFQTLLLIASGKSVSEIANNLSLSVATVSTYRARILEKMNLKTNADLINYSIQNKLV